MDDERRRAIQKIIKKLPAQGEKALKQLADLMEELTVGQIVAVASEVKRRVGLLNLFKERCLGAGAAGEPAWIQRAHRTMHGHRFIAMTSRSHALARIPQRPWHP